MFSFWSPIVTEQNRRTSIQLGHSVDRENHAPTDARRSAKGRKMKGSLKVAVFGLITMFLASCGLFDSGVVWRGGPYALIWIDIPDDVKLSYDLGKGSWIGRIEERVFAVGWDGRYLVAQQHPKGNKKITNYFIIDAKKDSPTADPRNVVIGPLTEVEYKTKSAELNLPPFKKELASLK